MKYKTKKYRLGADTVIGNNDMLQREIPFYDPNASFISYDKTRELIDQQENKDIKKDLMWKQGTGIAKKYIDSTTDKLVAKKGIKKVAYKMKPKKFEGSQMLKMAGGEDAAFKQADDVAEMGDQVAYAINANQQRKFMNYDKNLDSGETTFDKGQYEKYRDAKTEEKGIQAGSAVGSGAGAAIGMLVGGPMGAKVGKRAGKLVGGFTGAAYAKVGNTVAKNVHVEKGLNRLGIKTSRQKANELGKKVEEAKNNAKVAENYQKFAADSLSDVANTNLSGNMRSFKKGSYKLKPIANDMNNNYKKYRDINKFQKGGKELLPDKTQKIDNTFVDINKKIIQKYDNYKRPIDQKGNIKHEKDFLLRGKTGTGRAEISESPLDIAGDLKLGYNLIKGGVKIIPKLVKSGKKIINKTDDVIKGFKYYRKPINKTEIDWAKWNKEIPDNAPLMKEYNTIKQTSKANGTWMKNPDGSVFTGTPEQFIQQNSKNFKKAFPQGATNTFRGSGVHQPELINNESFKSVFTGNENLARFYGNSYSNKNYQNYFNPNISTGDELLLKNHPFKDLKAAKLDPKNKSLIKAYSQSEEAGIYNLYSKNTGKNLKIDAKGADWKKLPQQENLPYLKSNDDVAKYIDDNDLDQAFIKNVQDGITGDVLIAAHKKGNYLKSAIGNNGMFDMANPNIYKAIVPATIGTKLVNDGKKSGLFNKFQKGGKELEKKENTLDGDIISKVIMNRNKDKDFVKRAFELKEKKGTGEQKYIQNFDGSKSTHLMWNGEDRKGQSYMYPEIENNNGKLEYLGDKKPKEMVKIPNQYAEYISSKGYKKASGMDEFQKGGKELTNDINKVKKYEDSLNLYKISQTNANKLKNYPDQTSLVSRNQAILSHAKSNNVSFKEAKDNYNLSDTENNRAKRAYIYDDGSGHKKIIPDFDKPKKPYMYSKVASKDNNLTILKKDIKKIDVKKTAYFKPDIKVNEYKTEKRNIGSTEILPKEKTDFNTELKSNNNIDMKRVKNKIVNNQKREIPKQYRIKETRDNVVTGSKNILNKYSKGTREILTEDREAHFVKKGSKYVLINDTTKPNTHTNNSNEGRNAMVVPKNKYKLKDVINHNMSVSNNPKESLILPEGSTIVTAEKGKNKLALNAYKRKDHATIDKIVNSMPKDKYYDGNRSVRNTNTNIVDENHNLKTKSKKYYAITSRVDTGKKRSEHQKTVEKRNRLTKELLKDDANFDKMSARGDIREEKNGGISYKNDITGQWELMGQKRRDMSGTKLTPKGFNTGTSERRGIVGADGKPEISKVATSSKSGTPSTKGDLINSLVKSGKPLSGLQGLRATDLYNMWKGLKSPDKIKLRDPSLVTENYTDTSAATRRAYNEAKQSNVDNARNTSSGSSQEFVNLARTASQQNADSQADINEKEVSKMYDINNRNVDRKNQYSDTITDNRNQETLSNLQLKLKREEQFEKGLEGMDESNYRNRQDNRKAQSDEEANRISLEGVNNDKEGLKNSRLSLEAQSRNNLKRISIDEENNRIERYKIHQNNNPNDKTPFESFKKKGSKKLLLNKKYKMKC